MKHLDTITIRVVNFSLRAQRVAITNVNYLLIWIKMLLNVGFVITVAVAFGILFVALELIRSYRNGTKSHLEAILVSLMFCLWIQIGIVIDRSYLFRENFKP